MKVRKLKALGFRATFNDKGTAILSLPAVELPAEAAEAFSEADLARGLSEGAQRLKDAAEKLLPSAGAPA